MSRKSDFSFWFVLFIACFLLPTQAYAQSVPNIAEMFVNSKSSVLAVIGLVQALAYLLGVAIVVQSALSFKEYSESGGRTQLKTPVSLFLIGAFLIAFPSTVNMATTTLSLGASSGTNVMSEFGVGSALGLTEAIQAILLFIKMVGFIAVVRGFLIFKSISQGSGGQNTPGKALTHIAGGAFAINIDATIQAFAATVGMPM